MALTLPPAPVRETDADGNWINKDQFKRDSAAYLAGIPNVAAELNRLASTIQVTDD